MGSTCEWPLVTLAAKFELCFCGAVCGLHTASSAGVGTLARVGTHTFHKTGPNQAARAAPTCAELPFSNTMRW
jgi:hypothetical protein